MRILIVDDFPQMADSLAGVLRNNGHAVRVAYNGEEALRVAGAFEPHALISDVHMPGLDGFELAQAFAERFPTCGVLLMTVDSALIEHFQGRVYKMIQKPVALEALREFLDSCRPDG